MKSHPSPKEETISDISEDSDGAGYESALEYQTPSHEQQTAAAVNQETCSQAAPTKRPLALSNNEATSEPPKKRRFVHGDSINQINIRLPNARFSVEDTRLLEQLYERTAHPDEANITSLSRKHGMNPSEVWSWFEERRNRGDMNTHPARNPHFRLHQAESAFSLDAKPYISSSPQDFENLGQQTSAQGEGRTTEKRKESHPTAEVTLQSSNATTPIALSSPIVASKNKQFWRDVKFNRNFQYGPDHAHRNTSGPTVKECRTFLYNVRMHNNHAVPIADGIAADLPSRLNHSTAFESSSHWSYKVTSDDFEGASALLDITSHPKIFACTMEAFNTFPRSSTTPTATGEKRFSRNTATKKTFKLEDFYGQEYKTNPRGYHAALELMVSCSAATGLRNQAPLLATRGGHTGDYKGQVRNRGIFNGFLQIYYGADDRPNRFVGGGRSHSAITQWYEGLAPDAKRAFRIFATQELEKRLPKAIKDKVNSLKEDPRLSNGYETPILNLVGIKYNA
ncbi:hypothetical protein N431DRAFT_474585 [Stipitochalara longipes BDJ]|nr:hypothetical protein N431DRAFT_474585 [Stipitochalara longipes BDJ]